MRDLQREEFEKLRAEVQAIEDRYAKLLTQDDTEDKHGATLARLQVAGAIECAAAVEVENISHDEATTHDEGNNAHAAINHNAPSIWRDQVKAHIHALSSIM